MAVNNSRGWNFIRTKPMSTNKIYSMSPNPYLVTVFFSLKNTFDLLTTTALTWRQLLDIMKSKSSFWIVEYLSIFYILLKRFTALFMWIFSIICYKLHKNCNYKIYNVYHIMYIIKCILQNVYLDTIVMLSRAACSYHIKTKVR